MPQSTESETGTTNKLLEAFAKVTAQLIEISKKIPEAQKEFEPLAYWQKHMKDSDVILEYRIVAHTKEGEILNIEGVNNLPRVFDESMIPEAPTNFENAFNACIVRPSLNAFMKHMRVKVEEVKRAALTFTPSSLELSGNSTNNSEFISG